MCAIMRPFLLNLVGVIGILTLSACTGERGGGLDGELWCYDGGLSIKRLSGGSSKAFEVLTALTGAGASGSIQDFAVSKDGHAWLAASDGKLYRFSTETGDLEATVSVGTDAKKVAAFGSYVYAHTDESSELKLVRVNPTNNSTTPYSWGASNYDPDTVKFDSSEHVYGLSRNPFHLLRLDAATAGSALDKEVQSTYGYGDFAISGDSVWVVNGFDDKINRLSLSSLATDGDFGFALPFSLDNTLWVEASSDRLAILSRDSKKLFTIPQSVAAASDYTETDLSDLPSLKDAVGDGESIAVVASSSERNIHVYSISDGQEIGTIDTQASLDSALSSITIGATYCDLAD